MRRFQKLNDGALFRARDIGAKTHVMNDNVPLRVAVHSGRANVVAAETIIRPELFATEAGGGISRSGSARRVGKQIPTRADKK